MELIVRRGAREDRVGVERTSDHGFRLRIGDRWIEVDAASPGAPGGPGQELRSLLIDGAQTTVAVHAQGDGVYTVTSKGVSQSIEVLDPLTSLARQTRPGQTARAGRRIRAYMPGRVVSILVAAGDVVAAGQGLVVLEAMKMQNEIQAEVAATIQRVCVVAGQTVDGGEILFELA